MTVDTRKVTGRRQLRYADFDELLADAERAAANNDRALGNWTPGQIYAHLATAINSSMDGVPFTAPWYIRWIVQTFFRRWAIEGPISPGFKLPKRAADFFVADATSTEEGLQKLRAAIERVKREPHRAPNAVLGQLSRADSDRMHLTHAAMHMSFLVPPTS